MSKSFKAWRIEKQTMGGCTSEHKVYLNQRVAQLNAQSQEEEFASFVALEVKVSQLTKTVGAVGHDVVQIDGTTEAEYHRRTGLAKLTKKEMDALGL